MMYVVLKSVQVKAHPRVVEGKYQWVKEYLRMGDPVPAKTTVVSPWEVQKHKQDVEDFISLATERWSNKYRVVAEVSEQVYESHDEMKVSLKFYDKGPGSVIDKGEVSVTFHFSENLLHINDAFLNESVQGTGLGTSIVHHAIEFGLKKGIKSVVLLANGTSGVYSWARMGFDWRDPMSSLVQEIKDGFRQHCLRTFKHFVQPKDIQHAWQIANYRIGDRKVGKEYLLTAAKLGYYGEINLDAYRVWKRTKGIV